MTVQRSHKLAVRAHMKATGESYSVANRRLSTPLHPFFAGLGFTSNSGLGGAMLNWMRPVFTLISTEWEGDSQALVKLGEAYGALAKRGHYFCYHHYTAEFIETWFLLQTFAIAPARLQEAYASLLESPQALQDKAIVTRAVGPGVEAGNSYLVLNRIAALLHADVATAKDSNRYTTYGTQALRLLWPLLPQGARTDFVQRLTKLIQELPAVEEANTDDIFYNNYHDEPPQPRPELRPGDIVKFKKDGQPWVVRAPSEHFTVLTRTASNKRDFGQEQYTIIDWKHSRRGAHNSFGYPVRTDEDVATLLEALEAPMKSAKALGADVFHGGLTLSRNQVSLRIQSVKPLVVY